MNISRYFLRPPCGGELNAVVIMDSCHSSTVVEESGGGGSTPTCENNDTVFSDNEQTDIVALDTMTRTDHKMLGQYRVLCARIGEYSRTIEEINDRLHEARKLPYKEERFLSKAYATLPFYKNGADLLQREQTETMNPDYNRHLTMRCLDLDYKRNARNREKLIGKKHRIIEHFREKKFIEMYQHADRILRTNDEITVDLKRLNQVMPLELMDIIGSYLTYTCRIHLLEDRYRFIKQVGNMSKKKSQKYLEYLVETDDYCATNLDDSLTDNVYSKIYPSYKDRTSYVHIFYKYTIKERRQRILYIYYKYRLHNEKAAFDMLTKFAMLFGK